MAHHNPGRHSVTIGDAVVTALNDGQFEAPADWVAGLDAGGLQAVLDGTFRPFPPRITLNAFLVERGDRKILVDAGAGNKFGAALGRVGGHLAALGIGPEAIDAVLLTHAHVDHVGGLTDDGGAAIFPRAELVLSRTEHDHWRDDATYAAAPEGAKGGFLAARAALDAYRERTRLIEDGAEVVPGIRAKALPGHTPGHTGYHIGTGAGSLLLWADIVHLPGVQFDHPDVGMVFDTNPAQAIATRRAIIDEVIDRKLIIGGMHLDFPTFAHLRRHAGRVEVVPMVWAPEA